jgi:hypothetical protein
MVLAKDYDFCRPSETLDRAQNANHFRGIRFAQFGVISSRQ